MLGWLARDDGQGERWSSKDIEQIVPGPNQRMKVFSELDMVADEVLDSSDSVGPEYEPNLQRTESATERNLPIPIIDDYTRVREFVSKVSGCKCEGVGQISALPDVQATVVLD